MKYLLAGMIFCTLLNSCFDSSKPMSANTRQTIDSISNAQIVKLQIEMDSLCKLDRMVNMPRLIDSVKQVRLKEIQEKLKNMAK